MPFAYANPASGPSAGGIGWFDFGNFTLTPGSSFTQLTGLLNNNCTVTFDISSPATSQLPYTAVQPNIGYFGTAAYTGITSNIALYTPIAPNYTNSQILISNIVVRDGFGNPVPNYTVFVADAESTNISGGTTESWNFLTNGPVWSRFTTAGPATPAPTLTGIGTNNATITGVNTGTTPTLVADYVLAAQTPTTLLLTSVGHQAVAIGFAVTRVTLLKNIGDRIDPSDQFQLNVTGTPSAQTTTVGNTTGLQTVSAQVNAIPGNTYTLSEIMAPGSASALSDYTQTVTVVNFTPGGSMPPTGTLPINFTPTLGDDVFYVIRNTAPSVFTKTVDKAFTNVGDILTYTISVENPNDTAINNVLVQDPTPFGTTYLGNITATQPYTGTDLASGITFTTIPANTTATVTWQVQVNTTPPMANPIPNSGTVTVPGGTSGNTNVVTTQINTAYLSINKAVDKLNADVGDILTYTIMLMNGGNVAANNVVITDAIPAGTTFVDGSLTGATGTPPTLTLTNPIAPGATTNVSFQVQVGDTIPNPNPLLNTASAAFTYTVDPANPNSANGTATSEAASTQINNADISSPANLVKSASPANAAPGDIITYTITIKNTGNVAANNVVLTDNVPAGTTFVPGSVTGATGSLPNLTLTNPIQPGGTATVTFQVRVNNDTTNPVSNTATVDYTYTVDPNMPNGVTGTGTTNTTSTTVNSAAITMEKTATPAGVATGDVITYTLQLSNTGNVDANNVVITDAIPAGTTFVAGSVTGATGTPPTLTLPASIPAGGSATVTFQVTVGDTLPNPNPIPNSASAAFTFTADPQNPNGETGTAQSNTTNTPVSVANLTTTKTADKNFAKPGDVITYTLNFQNTGNVPANNVVVTDQLPAGTTFIAGSIMGATGSLPTLTLTNPVPAGGSRVVTFQVKVNDDTTAPVSNIASAAFTYTTDPANPNSKSGTTTSNTLASEIRFASVTSTKTVSPAFVGPNGVLTYTITVTNTGNVAANNVVITDQVPSGTTFVPGSVTGATGTPPTLTLASPIAAGDSAVVTYQLKVGNGVPNPNPISNIASVAYSFTVDPANPNGASGTAVSEPITSEVTSANLDVTKSTNKSVAYIGDTIMYQISVKNTGNTPTDNVVITDLIPTGTTLVPGSLTVSAPYSGAPDTGITLTNSIAPEQVVTVSFQITVGSMPNPNPIVNIATVDYNYTLDPAIPDGESATATSNSVTSLVFSNNYSQQISDLVSSVALEEAGLAAIINAEGAKIQAAVAMGNITAQELLCINKSVSDMMDSISMLEAILKQKLSLVNCQIDGTTGC